MKRIMGNHFAKAGGLICNHFAKAGGLMDVCSLSIRD